MDSIDISEGIIEAYRILQTGPMPIWRMLNHAQEHLDKEIQKMLKDPALPDS